MKKILLLLLATIGLISCEDKIVRNDVAMQGKINNASWKATNVYAEKTTSGGLYIQGTTGLDQITLKTNSINPGAYILGTINVSNSANYSFVVTPNNGYNTSIFPSAVRTVSVYLQGTGYVPMPVFATIGGSGTGLTLDAAVNLDGKIDYVEIRNPGNGYKTGDIVTLVGGNNDAKILIVDVVKSNGEVTITNYDGATVSGNFKFTAVNNLGETKVCKEGVFYKLPLN